jgi:hypothetical protein
VSDLIVENNDSHPEFRFAPAAPINKNNRINRLILARILHVYQCCAEVEPHAWTDCRSQLNQQPILCS